MPVDNELYDRVAGSWWDEDEFIFLLAALNPVRLEYFERVLRERHGADPGETSVLDVGCGGGLTCEELARSGYRVAGVDPSAPSIETARAHAAEGGLEIEYRVGAGESLPFDDGAFDVVYSCDTLEHVEDLAQVIREVARVLRPGGTFLYDTINRTLRSKLLFIKLAQEWSWTSFMAPDVHDHEMFIKPRELEELMARAGLESRDVAGIAGANPIAMIGPLRKLKRGEISYSEFGERLDFHRSRDKSGLYIGYSVKA